MRLFVTLVRFDAAYHGLFKCNLHRLTVCPALRVYVGRVLTGPGVRETVNMDQIKRSYCSINAFNPTLSGPDPLGLDPIALSNSQFARRSWRAFMWCTMWRLRPWRRSNHARWRRETSAPGHRIRGSHARPLLRKDSGRYWLEKGPTGSSPLTGSRRRPWR